MKNLYIYFYNNLIKLTTDKKLYQGLKNNDTFSDRLILFLLHFAFFLKIYKNEKNSKILQDLYDFCFKQLELSIREIGYGDQSINKKMKEYINLFHSIISEVHFWENLDKTEKSNKINKFLPQFKKIEDLVEYFDRFNDDLSKKTLKSYLKSVSKP